MTTHNFTQSVSRTSILTNCRFQLYYDNALKKEKLMCAIFHCRQKWLRQFRNVCQKVPKAEHENEAKYYLEFHQHRNIVRKSQMCSHTFSKHQKTTFLNIWDWWNIVVLLGETISIHNYVKEVCCVTIFHVLFILLLLVSSDIIKIGK